MISTISGVTDMVDIVFMTVITFVAFFIISVALLRNVLAGAYCAFPKFWDAVADAHKDHENDSFYESITGIKDSYKTASMSTLKTAVFRIVPNIKVLTDFEEKNLSAKDYFIKAIPQMIIVVIIGVFIYNGYYRDFTSILANTGAEFIERTVLSFDPVGAFDTLMNTAGRPTFASDDALDEYTKRKNRIANGIYDLIVTKYTDIQDADSKASLASYIDNVVNEIFGDVNDPNYFWLSDETGAYDVVYRVEMVKDFDPTASTRGHDINGDKFQYAWKIGLGKQDMATSGVKYDGSAMSNAILFDSTVDAVNEQWYISVKIGAQRKIVSDGSTAASGGTLKLAIEEDAELVFAGVNSIDTDTTWAVTAPDTNSGEIDATVSVEALSGGKIKLSIEATNANEGTVNISIGDIALNPPIHVNILIDGKPKTAYITHISDTTKVMSGNYTLNTAGGTATASTNKDAGQAPSGGGSGGSGDSGGSGGGSGDSGGSGEGGSDPAPQ